MSSRPAGAEAPECAGPDRNPRKPKLRLPPHACDAHAHIMGPKARYAYSPARVYTPPDCLLPDYLKMLATLGVERHDEFKNRRIKYRTPVVRCI